MKKDWIYIAVFCFLSSCAHIEQTKETRAPSKPPDIPSPVVFQTEKEKPVDVPRQEELFSFMLRDGDVRESIRAIGKQCGYNVVFERDVSGTTTIDLKDVSLNKALEYILEPLGFTYKIESRTIYVSKPKPETQVFSLNYVALKKIGSSNVYATPGAMTGTTTGGGASGSQVSIKNETESDLWKSLEDNIKALISKEGRFVVNKQSMIIFVSDYPKYLKDIKMFLDTAEGVIHRQVVIEAKIVEVQLNDESRQGVNWEFVDANIGSFRFQGQQSLLNQLTTASSSSTAVSGTPFFRLFVGNKNLDIDNTFIDLLKIYGKVETISSPKIATMNNQRAIIKVTKQDVYFDVDKDVTNGVVALTYTPKFIDVGLTLDVTPQIDDRDNIILNVHPIVSEKVSEVTTPDGYATVPVLDVREVDTIVKIKEGETVVIGGLIKNRKSTTDTGTKWFMDIPVIKHFFKVSEEEVSKNELVIFLTPRIIYGASN